MKRTVALVGLILLGCTPAPSRPFVGLWGTRRPATPAACEGTTLELTRNGRFEVKSAGQVVTARYQASASGNGHKLVLTDLHVTDQPNCQGYSADEVRRHQLTQLYLAVRNDTMWFFADPDSVPLDAVVRVRNIP